MKNTIAHIFEHMINMHKEDHMLTCISSVFLFVPAGILNYLALAS